MHHGGPFLNSQPLENRFPRSVCNETFIENPVQLQDGIVSKRRWALEPEWPGLFPTNTAAGAIVGQIVRSRQITVLILRLRIAARFGYDSQKLCGI
jgi:hypothetical protein